MNTKNGSVLASSAFKFILMIGAVDFFADLTYEGGASINGQFLETLGASALAVSVASGLGEFLGYVLRPVSGYLADKTGRYWLITFIGYALNLFAVPAMFLAGNWPVAAALILVERIGRALRKPTVEGMLSYTTATLGRGWVYALNTVFDEMGAALGPLVTAAVLFLGGDYKSAYALLLVSSLLAFGTLTITRIRFPVPARFDRVRSTTSSTFSRSYWLFMVAGAFFAAGFLSYELIPFHFAATRAVSPHLIPILLALSTGCAVVANLVLGKLYDRAPLRTLLTAVFLSSLFAPFVFFNGLAGILIGMVLWGIAYATQDTLLSAIIAGLLPEGKRNLAFGLFYIGYGGGILFGSVVTGLLYAYSIPLAAAFAFFMQLLSMPLFFIAHRKNK